MFIAHEFGDMHLRDVKRLDPEMVGWWIAFFKTKNKYENTPTKQKPGRGAKTK